ncbi:MAG: oligoendopeptidase F [Melioribacteraceae bacterium]|nr:oligoendopeptidase F [Melioribacteraceae bacterium]
MNMFFNQNEAQTGLPIRDEIDEKYKWNLKEIYKNEDLWEDDFRWLKASVSEYKKYEGLFTSSPEKLIEFFKFDEVVGIKFSMLIHYAFMVKDQDLAVSKYQSMYDRAMTLSSELDSAGSFMRPEILELSDEVIARYFAENENLGKYRHLFDNILRSKNHSRSKEVEELLAEVGRIDDTPYNTFSFFNNADIEFPTVEDEKGTLSKLSHGRYSSALFNQNRDYRERVYKNFYKPYIQNKNMLASLFNGNIKTKTFHAKARKYNSTREAALDTNNIPISVYDNLISSINKNLTPLHRWLNVKKKVLNLDEFHPYDSYVSLFPEIQKKYTYEEGREIVIESLKPLGDEYLSFLNKAFNERWIDVHETKGKRSGAYSSGTIYTKHPFVLLNWNDQLNDVFTLAHEMGHNMHSYLTGMTQPYIYSNYTIFVAEVASTVNEALLLDFLIRNAKSEDEKLFLFEKYLLNVQTTFYRQTRFAEYEQLTHSLVEKGEALTAESLTKYFSDMYQKYWGEKMVVDEEEGYSWARVPHFYYNFYVYQYATGFSAAEALSMQILNDGETSIEKYLNFLKSGSSDYSINLLRKAGVDMDKPEPVNAVIDKANKILDQLESIL